MRILLLLCLSSFFYGDVFAQCNGLPTDCLGTQSFTASPLATNGFYASGTVVTFCYTMQNYNQCNSNWFHTVDINLGPGWDASTITPVAIPMSCDGVGNWGFYSSVTSANTGINYGPCFSYDSPLGFIGNVLDGIPGNNFGDNCTTYTWTFCFSVMVAIPSYGQSLSVDINALGDGSAGSWTSSTCPGTQFNICNAYSLACFLSVAPTVVNPTCLNNDGSISLSVTGSNGSSTYTWSPGGQTTSGISGLSEGTYVVLVSDSLNCTATDTFNLSFFNPVTLNTITTNASCYGYSDASAYIFPAGGAAPYSFDWQPTGQTASSDTALSAGTYYVTVSDSNFCERIDTIVITSPSEILMSPFAQDVSCFASHDGWAVAPATGGAGIYYYNWQPTGQNSDTAKNLAAGVYTVTATDINGCFSDTTVTVGSPPQILIAPSITDVSCFGYSDGSISTAVSQGVPPYQYLWIETGSSGTAISNVPAGSYSLKVTDANGCVELDTLIISQPDSLAGVFNVSSPGCPAATDGAIEINVTGGTVPYYYIWNSNASLNASSLSGLSSGNFEVAVTDAHGCSFTMNQTVQSLPDLVIDAGPDVSIELGKGATITATVDRTGDFFYQWTPGYHLVDSNAASTYAYPYITTTYTAKVTDVYNGCTGNDSVTVIILPTSYVLVPSAFSPNSDGLNDLLFPVMGDLVKLDEFKIFNRWGQLVFTDKTTGWDGKFEGKLEEVGSYVYEVKYKVEGRTEEYGLTGSVILIR